ncbi:hypothetical protein SAMD00023353_7600050 [Rosellinia necatrix]|uniref:Uncharacterized protein n=1 Tax=Rosellinia necatrix TaxID=77044 RepID=A0A1S8AB44_ROSNE|nr:hypothetical protein SAMD00023353_7600050 [Rosellinia necatrix]
MCWVGQAYDFCDVCSQGFNRRPHIVRCRANKSGRRCVPKSVDRDAIRAGQMCEECDRARQAEEQCQRMIYRLRPLNLPVMGKPRMSALFAAYR